MDRRRMNGEAFEKLREAAGKYKYVLAVALLGVVLMLLPGGRKEPAAPQETARGVPVQSEMESVLGTFEGVGRLRLMLTVEPGTERWAGALVVCEGAGSAEVRLELMQALRALTGLKSDQITIVKGKP